MIYGPHKKVHKEGNPGCSGKVVLQAHNQLHGLVATDGDGAGDLLVTADAERAHGVARASEHWLLAGQLLQHLHVSGTSVYLRLR